MNSNYYLAVDIGASSGRHMLSYLEDGKMQLEEIYRFSNGMVEKDGHKIWDVDHLFAEILHGMKKCANLGKIPYSMGIDTWAVDFMLLDKEDHRLTDAVAYRDDRTIGMEEKVYQVIDEASLYKRTGIQKQSFNTIYQLMALKEKSPEVLEQAKTLLMIPDYFHFLLTGKKIQEYTNATTTQLVDPVKKDWDYALIEQLGYPSEIFLPIHQPGDEIGHLREAIAKEVGFDCKVILPPTHDTASAVAAVPATENHPLYLSSGTWSLMGTEQKTADCSNKSRTYNFTNEGGYEGRFRYLKNIMGLWMIQSVKKEMAEELSFGELCDGAKKETITSIVDVNDARFLAPSSMVEEVRNACLASGQEVPRTATEIACVIYNSLAKCYAKTVAELESLTGGSYDVIHVIGGGANAEYPNRLTANYTGKDVLAGPTEATAIGNLLVQMIASGEFLDLQEARKCVRRSFSLKEYRAGDFNGILESGLC